MMSHADVFFPQAIEQLNVKPKNFKDLLTDEPFKRSDMITIQVCCLVYCTTL